MVYIFSIAHQIKPIINYDQSWQEDLDPLKEYIQSWYNSIIIFFFQLSISNLASPSISFSVIIRIESKSKIIIAYGVICCSYNLIIIKSLFTVKTFGHGSNSNLDFSPTPIRHGLSKENFCITTTQVGTRLYKKQSHSVSKVHFCPKKYKFLKSLKNGQFLLCTKN